MSRQQLRRVGQLLHSAEQSGPGSSEIGTTVADSEDGWVDVSIVGQVVPCRVPGSHRNTVRAGQDVRLTRSGSVRTVTEIISPIATLATDVTPPDSEWSPATMTYMSNFTDAGFSNSGFTTQDWQIALYAEEIAYHTNDMVDDFHDLRSDYLALQTSYNQLAETVRSLRRSLLDQGIIV